MSRGGPRHRLAVPCKMSNLPTLTTVFDRIAVLLQLLPEKVWRLKQCEFRIVLEYKFRSMADTSTGLSKSGLPPLNWKTVKNK